MSDGDFAKAPRERQLDEQRLGQVHEYVARNFAQRMGVKDMARAAGLSPFHFSRLFKAATGKSPHRYLVEVRMREAARLLDRTSLPISEIAGRCGFATHAHFTGVFGRSAGMTPDAYRYFARRQRREQGEGARGHGPDRAPDTD